MSSNLYFSEKDATICKALNLQRSKIKASGRISFLIGLCRALLADAADIASFLPSGGHLPSHLVDEVTFMLSNLNGLKNPLANQLHTARSIFNQSIGTNDVVVFPVSCPSDQGKSLPKQRETWQWMDKRNTAGDHHRNGAKTTWGTSRDRVFTTNLTLSGNWHST